MSDLTGNTGIETPAPLPERMLVEKAFDLFLKDQVPDFNSHSLKEKMLIRKAFFTGVWLGFQYVNKVMDLKNNNLAKEILRDIQQEVTHQVQELRNPKGLRMPGIIMPEDIY